ncbi:hypothetical protein ACF0H5_022784 [Mactra antiquata]
MCGGQSFPNVPLSKDRIFIITGANTGIGYEIAKHCAIMGATVILACRSENRARSAMERMQQEYESEVITAKGNSKPLALEFMQVDFGSFKSVVNFCEEFKKSGRQLHVLFCNAGLGFGPYSATSDGLEATLQVNYLSQFLMVAKLMRIMEKSGPDCRIIFTSSRAYKYARIDVSKMNYTGTEEDFPKWDYYGRSKAYQIMQTYIMARRMKGSNITVNSYHPGIVATELARDVTECWLKCFASCIFKCRCARSPLQGATCGIDLAVNPEHASVTGHFWFTCRIEEPQAFIRDLDTQEKVWKETFVFLKDYITEDEINAMDGK